MTFYYRGSAVSQYSQHGRESVHGEEESVVLQEQMERAKQAIARADRVIADVNKRIDDVLEGNEEILDSIDSDAEVKNKIWPVQNCFLSGLNLNKLLINFL